jgi:Raf kinase inhibitor-like YbhB/YbcL family protein
MKILSLVAAACGMACVPALAMDVTSTDMADGAAVSLAHVYGQCGGANVSPALSWSGAPSGTRSFAVTTFDPDAHGKGWWHWIAFDIPASTNALPPGAGRGSGLPAGAVQGNNDFGEAGYDGPCPPEGSGLHHYQFTVWALADEKLPFNPGTYGAVVEDYLKKHALAHAAITPVLQR